MWDVIFRNLNVLIAVLSLFVSIYFYLKQKKKKLLDFKVLNNSSLLEIGEEIQKDVTILYKDNPVSAVNLIEIELKNNGNESIKKADFLEPIKLFFGKEAEILTYNVVNKEPPNLTVNIKFYKDSLDGDKISFLPKLMNPKEKFTVKLLVSKMNEMVLESRIEGVRKLRNELDFKVDYADIVMPFLFLLFGGFVYYVEKFVLETDLTILNYIFSAFFIIAGIYFIRLDSIPEIKKIILKYS